MTFQAAILYVDDEPVNLDVFKKAFGKDYRVETCPSAKEALELMEKEEFPLVIADQRMPGMTGIELCEHLFQKRPQTVRMILTAYTETPLLLQAIQRGHVHDYIVKPWTKSELKPILEKVLEDCRQKMMKLEELKSRADQADLLKEEIKEIHDSDAMIGAGSGLKKVMETMTKAIPTDSTILLLGETGTGKELLARAIHARSLRNKGPFVPVHCAALAKTLLESELFGHEKGAFTGADQARQGRFERAKGGTLFLDEVGEIPEETQVKLLRVLQEREIERVGGNRPVPIDVRLIAATHRDLSKDVREGRFREDLFYRLNVIVVKIPPLRERKEDLPALAEHFLKKFSRQTGSDLKLSDQALDYLTRYDWPGNVRELENILERTVILAPGPTIDPEDFHLNLEEILKVDKVDLAKMSSVQSLREDHKQKEIESLMQTLSQAKGNIAEAARMLGMGRTTLFYRLKKYQLL